MALTQPKKPAGGAYMIFTNEKRAEFQNKCKGQPVSAVSKMASEEWKKLSEAQKVPYQKKYEEAKAKFDKDMAAFLAAGGVKEKGAAAKRAEKRKAKEGGKKKKDPNAPKKPAGGAYGVYLSENRAKIVASLPAGHKMTDVAKAAGEQWKALSAAAKKPYEDTYEKKNAEYKKAIEAYKKANPVTEEADEEEDEEDGDEEEEEEEEEEEDEEPVKKKPAVGGEPVKKKPAGK